MTSRVAREIRRLLNLPRLPKAMSPLQRKAYRTVKAKYAALPAPARARFLANVELLKSTMTLEPV